MKRILLSLILVLAICGSTFAQLDGARVYWPLPKNTNLVGVHVINGTLNATVNNLERVQPNFDVENKMYMLTYTRIQPIFGRTTAWTLVAPAAELKSNSTVPLTTFDPYAHGFGDLMFGSTINLIGAPGLKAKDYIRYDLNFNVSLGLNVSFPTGQYDSDELLNIGSHRFKYRFSLPMVKSLMAWVPGGRTTLEVVPSVTLLSDNTAGDDYTVEQSPVYAIESHLTRDLAKRAWVSLDYTYITGGRTTTVDNSSGASVSGKDMVAGLFGATVNFTINDNLQLFLTHMQSVDNDSTDPITLEGALFKATLIWSWHGVLQKVSDFHD